LNGGFLTTAYEFVDLIDGRCCRILLLESAISSELFAPVLPI
jgi:hypothetical protein